MPLVYKMGSSHQDLTWIIQKILPREVETEIDAWLLEQNHHRCL